MNGAIRIKKVIFQKEAFRILTGSIEGEIPADLSELPAEFFLKGKHLPSSGAILVKTYKVSEYKGKKGLDILSFEKIEEVKTKKMPLLSLLREFPDVGTKRAEEIYSVFEDSFMKLIFSPELRRISKIKGITPSRYDKIEKFIQKNESDIRLFIELNKSFDIWYKDCQKINKKFKGDAISELAKNPYLLSKSIGLLKADFIAKEKGMTENAPERIAAFAHYVLSNVGLLGDMYSEKEDFLRRVNETLSKTDRPYQVSEKEFFAIVKQMMKDQKIYAAASGEKYLFYSRKYWEAENLLAYHILRLAKGRREQINLKDIIKRKEKQVNVILSEEQKYAVEEALLNPITIISGGPGTGKTTIVNFIYNVYLEQFKGDVLLCAPTGRAARKMSESTKSTAVTINSALGLFPVDEDEEYEGDSTKPNTDISRYSLIIVDEMSMLDAFLGKAFFESISNGTKVVLIGDVDQLPSVGPGFVLSDLIESKKVPTIQLEKIYRQADDSLIAVNAKYIKEGKTNLSTNNSFDLMEEKSGDAVIKKAVDIFLKEASVYNADNVAVLSPFRKGKTGAIQINDLIRKQLPKEGRAFRIIDNRTFRVGDKVMQTKNRNFETINRFDLPTGKKEFISNGDIGYIKKIKRNEIIIDFGDDRVISASDQDMRDIVFAYAMSVHKSQGSEYHTVIIVLTEDHKAMLNRNLIYTAVTRAKKRVIIVGKKEILDYSIQRGIDKFNRRKTSLGRIIRNKSKKATS